MTSKADNEFATSAAPTGYLEEMEILERRLYMLADLCCGCMDGSRVRTSVVETIGMELLDFLEQKQIADHFFLGRPLLCETEGARLQGIRVVLTERHGPSEFAGSESG